MCFLSRFFISPLKIFYISRLGDPCNSQGWRNRKEILRQIQYTYSRSIEQNELLCVYELSQDYVLNILFKKTTLGVVCQTRSLSSHIKSFLGTPEQLESPFLVFLCVNVHAFVEKHGLNTEWVRIRQLETVLAIPTISNDVRFSQASDATQVVSFLEYSYNNRARIPVMTVTYDVTLPGACGSRRSDSTRKHPRPPSTPVLFSYTPNGYIQATTSPAKPEKRVEFHNNNDDDRYTSNGAVVVASPAQLPGVVMAGVNRISQGEGKHLVFVHLAAMAMWYRAAKASGYNKVLMMKDQEDVKHVRDMLLSGTSGPVVVIMSAALVLEKTMMGYVPLKGTVPPASEGFLPITFLWESEFLFDVVAIAGLEHYFHMYMLQLDDGVVDQEFSFVHMSAVAQVVRAYLNGKFFIVASSLPFKSCDAAFHYGAFTGLRNFRDGPVCTAPHFPTIQCGSALTSFMGNHHWLGLVDSDQSFVDVKCDHGKLRKIKEIVFGSMVVEHHVPGSARRQVEHGTILYDAASGLARDHDNKSSVLTRWLRRVFRRTPGVRVLLLVDDSRDGGNPSHELPLDESAFASVGVDVLDGQTLAARLGESRPVHLGRKRPRNSDHDGDRGWICKMTTFDIFEYLYGAIDPGCTIVVHAGCPSRDTQLVLKLLMAPGRRLRLFNLKPHAK